LIFIRYFNIRLISEIIRVYKAIFIKISARILHVNYILILIILHIHITYILYNIYIYIYICYVIYMLYILIIAKLILIVYIITLYYYTFY